MIKIFDINKLTLEEILSRETTATGVEEIVAGIIFDVKQNGDAALYKYCEKFDKVSLSSLEVTEEEIEEAMSLVEPEFIEIIKEAAENITLYHKNQVQSGFEIKKENGIILGLHNLFSLRYPYSAVQRLFFPFAICPFQCQDGTCSRQL